MENTGLDSDVPTGPPQVVSGKVWLCSLLGYVNTMRRNCPNVTHPPDDWLTDGAQLYSSGQNPSAVGGSSIQPDTSRDKLLVNIQRTLDKHTRRNTAIEVGKSILISRRKTGKTEWQNSK